MKRIGIIDVDTRNFPNIALMKISAFRKSIGDNVEWYDPMFGGHFEVYMSKVFSWTPDYAYPINADEVQKGGTGYAISMVDGKEVFDKSKDVNLDPAIEHIYPDYSLYPQLTQDTAFGFLSRGCPRGCSFCIVAGKEGRKSVKVANLEEFWRGQSKVVLCDPNILACPDWAELLEQCAASGAEFDFNQGMDARMLTREKIDALNQLRIKEIHFAWDRYNERDLVLPKLELFAKYSKMKGSHNMMVFTICNFDTTLEQDLDRIYTLRDMGYWPYVAIYDIDHCDRVYKRLQIWVNNRWIFGVVKRFEDYKG